MTSCHCPDLQSREACFQLTSAQTANKHGNAALVRWKQCEERVFLRAPDVPVWLYGQGVKAIFGPFASPRKAPFSLSRLSLGEPGSQQLGRGPDLTICTTHRHTNGVCSEAEGEAESRAAFFAEIARAYCLGFSMNFRIATGGKILGPIVVLLTPATHNQVYWHGLRLDCCYENLGMYLLMCASASLR